MITKNDCLLQLFDLKNKGIDVEKEIKQLITTDQPTIEIIKKINDNMELNVRKFYEKLRKSYNKGSSKLYINIVKSNEIEPKEVLCALGSLQLQILLFNKNLDDPTFLRNARFDEISKCLLNYYNTGDIINCNKLLGFIRADLKLLEEISKEK